MALGCNRGPYHVVCGAGWNPRVKSGVLPGAVTFVLVSRHCHGHFKWNEMSCPAKTFGGLKSPNSLIAQGGWSGSGGSGLLTHLGASQHGLMWEKSRTGLKIMTR